MDPVVPHGSLAWSVGQISDRLDLAPATVSEHLKVLRKTGLVRLERRGAQWRYRADPARVRAVLHALHADLTPPT